jgi:hypothetical protein
LTRFAEVAKTPSLVSVASKAYRRVALNESGNYIATLTYQDGETTVANWTVREIPAERKAKNVVLVSLSPRRSNHSQEI